MDKLAAIDLGTNTFHLLIASFDEKGRLVEHFRDRRYIHLAQEGIDKISPSAIDRAIACIRDFRKELDHYQISLINCSGTAALRTASNGPDLVNMIEDITGFKVNIIDGIKEARYIYEGVKLAVPSAGAGNHVVMDIGGGSVEFIVIKNGHFYWSNSYPIGIAVLKQMFHRQNPIGEEEIIAMNTFLGEHLKKFIHTVRQLKINSLIGASGSFEVLSGMFKAGYSDYLSLDIPVSFFHQIYQELVYSTLEARLARTDVPNDRAALIVVAFHLMHFVLNAVACEKITVSAYAMKEGILNELRNF